jgi:tetratricopeptide (TPR) repeat protein
MMRSRAGACLAAVWLLGSAASGQAQDADPKSAFTAALARFSLALDGAFGDEGPGISASLAAMDRARQQWDAVIRTYEAGLAAEVRSAPPELAARMHLALAGVYLDRSRFVDARQHLDEAIRLDARRADALTARALIEASVTARPREAADDFARAAALTPADPVRAYLHARQLLAAGGADDAVAAALQRFVSAQMSAGPLPDRAPFVRPGLVQEVPDIEPFFPPAAYRDGFAALAEGRYDDAVGRLRTDSILDPLVTPSAALAERLRAAAAALRAGNVSAALAQLRDAVNAWPRASEAHRLLGLAHLANEDADRGLAELKTAITLDASYERPRIDLARALFDSGQYGEAIAVLSAALAALPDSGRARYLLGLSYQRQGNYDRAMEELAGAAALEPLLGLNSIFQSLGALRRSQQDYAGAIDAFSRRVALVPNDATAHHELAEMYFRVGRLDEALAEHTVALMLDPRRAASYVGVAQVYLRAGRFADAATAAKRATELATGDKEARYVLATALLRLGRADEGNRELQEYQRLQAEATAQQQRRFEIAALQRDATVSAANGDHARAVALLRKALEAQPGDPSAERDLGLALLRAGQAADAIPHLRAAATPGSAPEVHRHLAAAYDAAGQPEDGQRERALYAQARQDALRRAGAGQ